MIVNVSKRNLIDKYVPYFVSKGFRVNVLDMGSPSRGTICFDPMSFIHGEKDILGVQNLADCIIRTDGHSSADSYWDSSSTDLLMAEILYCQTENRHPSIVDVLKYHNELKIEETVSGFVTSHDKDFENLPAGHPAVRHWHTFRQNSPTTAKCIYSELNTSLQGMFNEEYCRALVSKPQQNILSLASQPCILFVYTSPVNKQLHKLANLFMSFAIKNLFEFAEMIPEGKLPVPIDLVFDDFACGSKVQQFPELISIFREKGISTTIMLQSEAQLTGMYGEPDARTILDNCDTYVYMGGNNLENAQRVAVRCDVPDRKIFELKPGREIVIRRGARPVETERYDVMSDLEYQRVTREYKERMKGKEIKKLG